MIPDHWHAGTLGEFMEFKNGLNTDKSNYGHGTKFVNVMDIFRNNYLYADRVTGSVNITTKQRHEYSVRRGDVLFNRTSETFDEIAMSSVYLDSEEITFGGFVIRGRPIADELISEYLIYCLRTSLSRKEFIRRGQGAVRANIGQKDLCKVPILIPPKKEQTKIAQILSTWDQAISATEKLIENSKIQKKALMQQILTGKKRLPGFDDEWQEYRLGGLFSERKETKRPDLRLLSITQDRGVIYRDDVGRKDTSSKDKSKYKRLCPNDIGYNTMRMWQGVSALSDKEGIVSPAYTIIIPGEKANPLFFSHLFKLRKSINEFYRHSQGLVSDTWSLKYPHFSAIKVMVPKIHEQEKIAAVLKTADQQTDNLILQAKNLQQEKKALMQQLLTGKRRVKIGGEDL